MDSIQDAKNLSQNQRDTHKSYAYLTEQDLGDEAFSFSYFRDTYCALGNRIYIQVYGNIPLTNIKGYGIAQVNNLE